MEISELLYQTIEKKGVLTFLVELLSAISLLYVFFKNVFTIELAKTAIAFSITLLLLVYLYIYYFMTLSIPITIAFTLLTFTATCCGKFIIIEIVVFFKRKGYMIGIVLSSILALPSILLDMTLTSMFTHHFFKYSDYSYIEAFIDIIFLVIILIAPIKYYIIASKKPPRDKIAP